MKVIILTSRFYPELSDELEKNAEEHLFEYNVEFEKIEVRGCVELPLVAQHVIRTKKPDAVIALGIIIQGRTDHYKWVCESCERGLTKVGLQEHTPIVHGILVSPNRELVEKRLKNGEEYAITALSMIDILKK
jgi:6,7-dimethyl-8-ribityllumazine synthase